MVRVDDASIEALRTEALELFEQLPAPPDYRRTDDPVRTRAAELRGRAVQLLSRVLSALDAVPDERLSELRAALEAHVRALAAISDGDIGAGEALWREARDAQRGTTPFGKAWRAAASPPPAKVYDRATGESRYDPRPEPVVTVQLICPNACRKLAVYGLSPRYATSGLVCSTCHQPFTAYLAEARSVETSPRGAALHYTLTLDEPNGVERRIEFNDASGADLALAPRDSVALLYGRKQTLDALMNLTTGRVLFISSPGACFVATAVYGPLARETEALRRFRDQTLMPHRVGRLLIATYYRCSPPVAQILRRSHRMRSAARILLDGVVRRIE